MSFLKGKLFKRSIALLLTAVLLLAAVPSSIFAAASEAPLTFGVLTDTHYYAPSNVDDMNVFARFCEKGASASHLAKPVLESALEALRQEAIENDLKYILMPGDLTKDGDQASHRALAARLKEFEEDTGIQIFVINGNHDINNENAATFAKGKFVSSPVTSPELFKEIYADFGYNQADSVFTPSEGKKAGMLSYALELDGGYYLISLDGGKYSPDNTKEGRTRETGGNYSPELMAWAINEIKTAKAQGLEVIGMTHFNIVPHFECEDSLFVDFPIDNWQQVSEQFADAGMQVTFSGHIHCQDISAHTSDNGNIIYDCATTSILSFPNYLRTVTIDNTVSDADFSIEYNTIDVDRDLPVTFNGKAFERPFSNYSFGINFTGTDPHDFVMDFAEQFLVDQYIPEIREMGGLYKFLCEKLDLESLYDELLKGGIKVAGLTLISSTNLLGLTKSLCDQIDAAYINNPDRVMDIIDEAITKLLSLKVSDISCTKFIDTLGFGSATRPGNFGDVVSCCLAYFYLADEDISDDAFIQDVLAKFDRGEIAQNVFDTLIDIVLNDLLTDEIFASLNLKLASAFPLGSLGAVISRALDALIFIFTGFDNSFNGILKFGFKLVSSLGIVEYTSIEDILNHYINEYLTKSQMDTIAVEFGRIISSFCIDDNPAPKCDIHSKFSVTAGTSPVSATADNLRLPSNVSVTFGTDSATTRTISWYTKLSVTGSDIQLVPYSANPQFTSELPTGVSAAKTMTVTKRTFPGVDIGIIGVIDYYFNVNRHVVKLTGLQPGTKYSYRIGDASKGYWSEPAVIETADNSDSFTFFHMSDCQSGLERQYRTWANVVDQAYKLYPNSKFILHTGDFVDSGKNFKQWKWMFNTASSNLMDTVLMPSAGNHEEKGEYPLDLNFVLSNVPEQDTVSGNYYSFEYNNAYFAVLNSNNLGDDNGLSDAQIEWLKADAAKSDAQWKFVALHKAPYSNGSHYDDKDVIAIRKQLSTLMPQLGIDVVLQGHDHVYLRTDVLKNNKVSDVYEMGISDNGKEYTAKVNPDGTIYVIDACSGVKYYLTKDASETDKLFPRAEKIYDATLPVFSAFRINGDTLYFDAYTVDGSKLTNIDSFAIVKDASIQAPNKNGGIFDIFTDCELQTAA